MSFDQLLKKQTQKLSPLEMKLVSGGLMGTCGILLPHGGVACNLSQEEAEGTADLLSVDGNVAYWCCESCASNGGSASYC
ncbi:hypothetical protein [Pontibacter sp. G13]|uniref:hypothetical protein n=1 Tax=Pontibacter sp. G13 TaxID=3074898 RepID=UPI0028890DEB|nr:hypothetical protein [Pontibacter sp. G13]WNJ20367.1 hypothetical protein RJD25_07790 [Pontibacter sp. G13]